eukprot:CAMPEP_0170337290 /NCGR_PEP_ID=MMETSP0116_2-20130129/69691_1 /TAXON_ID=400756 /ORGANISM="Durinskia baltica, Strain CSIRO CS-38" /LENGTH=143 /DNA_ID=CAMNT_0010590685 /DNA_START=256 /DNA_END=686 /DNA_ORIENTATION=+
MALRDWEPGIQSALLNKLSQLGQVQLLQFLPGHMLVGRGPLRYPLEEGCGAMLPRLRVLPLCLAVAKLEAATAFHAFAQFLPSLLLADITEVVNPNGEKWLVTEREAAWTSDAASVAQTSAAGATRLRRRKGVSNVGAAETAE